MISSHVIVLVAFGFALALTLALVPIAKRFALRWGLVDLPDEKRKLHVNAIPLIGGLTIFVSVIISLVVTFLVFPELELNPKLIGLFLACLFILIVGICDDRFELRGRQKLLAQFLAATILIAFGFRFEGIKIYGQSIDFSVFSIIVVYAWLLIGTNSVNLLDGADGFATTIGISMSLALCAISFYAGRYENAVIAAAAAGAMIGFMRFNFPPATAYLGDAGSMLIGLFISAMAVHCSTKEAILYAFAAIALFAIPMFDTFAAIIRRQLTGRSIYTVDRGHLHHALLRKGFSPRKALLLFLCMCLMTATGATLAAVYRQAEYAIASILAVVIFLVVGRVFGVAEFNLVVNKIESLARSFVLPPKSRRSKHVSFRLQGERDWDLCWQVLREFAEKSDLVELTMDLNLPWIHESFHAKFKQADRRVPLDEQWTAELPLLVDDRIIGRIDLVGAVRESTFYDTIGELADVLLSLQPYFIQTMKAKASGEYRHEPKPVEQESIEAATTGSTDSRVYDYG